MIMIFSFAACGGGSGENGGNGGGKETESAMTEVKGVTIPAFTISVGGVKVTNDDMAAYPIYQATVDTVNSSGTAHSNVFVGFKLTDVFDFCGITEVSGKITPKATDDYTFDYEGDVDSIMIAMTKDGTQFKNGPWFCPTDTDTTGDILQDLKTVAFEKANVPEDRKEKGGEGGNGGSGEGEPTELKDPVAEDKSDKIVFGDFSFKINDKDVTNADLAGLKVWRITVTTQNSKGVISESKYSGYVLKDVLGAIGLSDVTSVQAVAADGYTSDLAAGLINNDLTIIAIEKDKETGENGTVWLAPCSETTGNLYARDVVSFTAQ